MGDILKLNQNQGSGDNPNPNLDQNMYRLAVKDRWQQNLYMQIDILQQRFAPFFMGRKLPDVSEDAKGVIFGSDGSDGLGAMLNSGWDPDVGDIFMNPADKTITMQVFSVPKDIDIQVDDAGKHNDQIQREQKEFDLIKNFVHPEVRKEIVDGFKGQFLWCPRISDAISIFKDKGYKLETLSYEVDPEHPERDGYMVVLVGDKDKSKEIITYGGKDELHAVYLTLKEVFK